MTPPSLVHVITGLETGGAEMMLLKLLSAGDPARWRQSVISLADRGTLGERIADHGVVVTELGIRGSVPTPRAAWRLMQEVRRISPRLIQGWMYHGNVAAMLAKLLTRQRIPVVWNIRYAPGPLAREKLTTAAVIRVGALLSPRAARIVYNSRAGLRRHAELGYATNHAVVIPNGFDTDVFVPSKEARGAWRRRLGISDSVILLGRIGRYHEMKDYATFLEAAALLLHERADVRFVLAGKGVDVGNHDLVGMVASLGLHGAVHLLGEVTAVNELTASLDVACSSSAYGEAFPSVLGEAMACAVPCVATDVGDSSWIVGGSGAVVPPKDAAALAWACRELVDAGVDGRRRLGSAARARVLREFSLSRVVKDYEALYIETIS